MIGRQEILATLGIVVVGVTLVASGCLLADAGSHIEYTLDQPQTPRGEYLATQSTVSYTNLSPDTQRTARRLIHGGTVRDAPNLTPNQSKNPVAVSKNGTLFTVSKVIKQDAPVVFTAGIGLVLFGLVSVSYGCLRYRVVEAERRRRALEKTATRSRQSGRG